MSRIRQNYREETEALVNQQINIQLTASYAYQVGSSYGKLIYKLATCLFKLL